ncbi:hypothetical protein C5C74_10785 [Rathayibacter sp. AY1E8]|nr:hypothetical protein C5C74_10785 [Rathayibacter sp. AY1E8]
MIRSRTHRCSSTAASKLQVYERVGRRQSMRTGTLASRSRTLFGVASSTPSSRTTSPPPSTIREM